MFHPQGSRHNNILGIVLIAVGIFTLAISLGDFIIRLAIAMFGIYLIYTGLRMRNQHNRIFLFFTQFGDRFNRS